VSALPIAAPVTNAAPPERTLERQAVDLVASGQYERAVFVYEKLARQYPDRPVYGEAARILRSKIDAGAP
jgi:TolA-binding protein